MEDGNQAAREELVRTAWQILDGSLSIIDGGRLISGLRGQLGESDAEDPIFHPFINVFDDALIWPERESRHLWAASYLSELDRDRAEYVAQMQGEIREAALRIISRYGRSTER